MSKASGGEWWSSSSSRTGCGRAREGVLEAVDASSAKIDGSVSSDSLLEHVSVTS